MLNLQTILFATDLSENAAGAFRLARSLARQHGARLIVEHVVPLPTALGYDEIPFTPPLAPGCRQEMDQKLRQFHPTENQTPIEYRLEQGFAAEEILRVADEVGADVIVMGTHGRSGLGRLLLGSVAEQVVRKAACPVLAVKGTSVESKGPIRAILHPTDLSAHSKGAFRLACALAADHQARVTCLHVRAAPHASLYSGTPVERQLADHDREEDEKLHRLVSLHFKIPVEHRMETGVPAEEIVRVARDTGCGLIVMGTHGRTGLRRVLMGSVAEQVLRDAPCPVLLVKPARGKKVDAWRKSVGKPERV